MPPQNPYTIRDTCRICQSVNLKTFLEFGPMPLAGGFLTAKQLTHEVLYPLTVALCLDCCEVQILETVSPQILFRDYRYLSSSTVSLTSHFKQYATEMLERFVKPGELVVEIGSNDGVLLRPLTALGLKAMGFEPALNIAKVAIDSGCEVITDFITLANAKALCSQHGHARLVCANNVFAHIDDIRQVVQAIDQLLDPTGIFVFEVHYLPRLFESLQYDFIYHEHLMYHSLKPLMHLLEAFNFEIFDAKEIPIHCGSIRVYAQKQSNPKRQKASANFKALLDIEAKLRLERLETYLNFAERTFRARDQLRDLVGSLVLSGKKVVGYGASGRATVHLNFSKLKTDLIGYVVDESAERLGRFIPGTHNPILPPEFFRNDKADYAVVFAYNYLQEISNKEQDFFRRGGKFIIPSPVPRIVQ